MTALTGRDRRLIAQARALAATSGEDALREHLAAQGLTPDLTTDGSVYPYAFGVTKYLLEGLADIAERLGGGDSAGAAAEDTRRLGEVRAVLAAFDWEHDDRQYALEAIERIAAAGDDDQADDEGGTSEYRGWLP